MASGSGEFHGEEEPPRAKHKVENIGTSSSVGNESLEQQPDDPITHVPKAANGEPCIAAMENYLLAHFFFIFAASFILGVIFLHSSLTFWSWQVYDESGPYTTHLTEIPDALPHEQNYQPGYRNGVNSFNEVLSAIISPNMTISLAR
ncbi:uncharacterized protein LOC135689511 [Rhopilema esculentum]|uniref:uncharacterized protein LOC135689511 n=1 Tax=Rhopilema esculentum TaxID=499914 RepID=UPI0031D4170A